MKSFPSSIRVLPEHGFAFPERRDAIHAAWWPLYIEPMVGSGERICFAVAVANNEGALVTSVPGTERLRCLYGKEADFLQFIGQAMTSQLEKSLANQKTRETFYKKGDTDQFWHPTIEGVHMGEISHGIGNSLEEITRIALMMSASLVEKLSDESEESNENLTHLRLEKRVQFLVSQKDQRMALHFSRFRRAGEASKEIDLGYVSNLVALNFAVLNPSTLRDNIKTAKSKLWDLELVQTKYVDEVFSAGLKHWELMLHIPAEGEPTISERRYALTRDAVAELEYQVRDIAAKEGKSLAISHYTTPETIADRVIEVEHAYRKQA
jgi:hypothetical protein